MESPSQKVYEQAAEMVEGFSEVISELQDAISETMSCSLYISGMLASGYPDPAKVLSDMQAKMQSSISDLQVQIANYQLMINKSIALAAVTVANLPPEEIAT